MRRWLLLGGVLTGLAACSAPPVDPDAMPHFGQVEARFIAGHDTEVIQVAALDRIAIRRAVLVMPGGARVPAYSIDAGQKETASLPEPATAVPGTMAPHSESIGQILSVALVRVPNPDDYAHGWTSARVEVVLGEGADRRSVVLAAPAPM